MPTVFGASLLYLSALSPFFISLIVLDGFSNMVFCIPVLVMVALSVLMLFSYLCKVKTLAHDFVHAKVLSSLDSAALWPFLVYPLPFFGVNLENSVWLAVLLVLLVLFGIFYIRKDLIYANPFFSLAGYRILRITTGDKQSILLSKYIYPGWSSEITVVAIGDNVFFHKLIE